MTGRMGRAGREGLGMKKTIEVERVVAFAELLSMNLRLCEIQAAMNMTKGEAASTMRRIRQDLGAQAR